MKNEDLIKIALQIAKLKDKRHICMPKDLTIEQKILFELGYASALSLACAIIANALGLKEEARNLTEGAIPKR